VPLLRPLFFILLTTIALTSYAQADDVTVIPATTGEIAPDWLPSARNVKIELVPEAPSLPDTQITASPAADVAASQPELQPPLPLSLSTEIESTSDAFVSDNKAEFVPPIEPVEEINAEPPPVWTPREETPVELANETDVISDSLWPRIRNGFAMQELDSVLISKHEQWYSSRPDYIKRMTDRARRYLYFIATEVEKRGMPSEIALLPMIESAFNPGAMSTTRASGIWQFMPATGKSFGLKQNFWYDDRRDVVGATNGALDYLQKLYRMFGDWQLALAAYNWGEGSVQRAQARNRKQGLPTDYPSLAMPTETRNYVPKLLAIKNIIANPASFGLTLSSIADEPYFSAVSTPKHIDVKLAAQLADISMEEFAALNPEHNRPVILQGKSNVILLPVNKTETFRANLENYDKPLVSWQSYQPKRGERLDQLAPRFGLSVANLKSVNGLSARENISTGQTLLVPLNGEENDIDFDAFNMHIVPIDVRVSALKHTVRRGDTYASLAKRYHVNIKNLKKLNKSAKLKIGRPITIALAATSRKNLGHRYVSRRHAGRYAASKHKGRGYASSKKTSRSYTAKSHARKVAKVPSRKRLLAKR
jgi:membrane-bound lytic murein transglycosylase D